MWTILISLLVLLSLSGPQWKRKFTVSRWRHALELDKHQSAYVELFATVDGFSLSREARSTQDAMEYVYGEIEFVPFIALLSLVNPSRDTVFYDLGSGTGKAVFACAMVFNVRESRGIELFDPLHKAACKQQQALSSLPEYAATANTIYFTRDDFLHADFNDATLVFINATGFFGTTWIAISERLAQTPTCTTVITTSKPLKSSAFTVTKITSVEMSWGIANAYIQHRIKID